MEMPPFTPPKKPLNPVFWRLLLFVACVLVFSFALHAKVAVYEQAQPQPHPSTSSKLWDNGAKFTLPPMTSGLSLVWLAVSIASLLGWQNSQRFHRTPVLACKRRHHHYLHRFLRPPPSR